MRVYFLACLLATVSGFAVAPSLRMNSLSAPGSSHRHAAPLASEVVIKEDFKFAGACLLLGPSILFAPWLFGGFISLLGLLLIVQTLRIRFVFDDEAFEVKTKDFDEILSPDSALVKTGDNFAVGGDNRWAYSSFVNWEFFPSVDLPLLVYFKETQTPKEKWEVGPGKIANSPEALAKGAANGQVHFFPCIADAQQIKAEFEKRGCARL